MTATFTGREVRSRVLLLTISLYLKAAITAVSASFEVARFILLALWSIRLNSLLFKDNLEICEIDVDSRSVDRTRLLNLHF